MKKLILFSVLFLSPILAHAEGKWEVSIGSTQMFVGGVKNQTFPLPTASSTLILSRTIYEDFALWAIVNFPPVCQQEANKRGGCRRRSNPPCSYARGELHLARV